MSNGKAIRLFLVDGTPVGLVTAEITNWTGHVLVGPRSRIGEVLSRPETVKTGVYFLVGEEDGRTEVYVGEGDCIADRVRAHTKDDDKQFWERVFFVTSKDFNLTKAHVRYLESRLVQKIKTASRAHCRNANVPAMSILPEADLSDMEGFLDQLSILLPVIGLDVLREPIKTRPLAAVVVVDGNSLASNETVVGPGSAGEIVLSHPRAGVEARGYEADGEVLVLEGSIGTGKVYSSNSYATLREQLISDGRVEVLPSGQIRFRTDVVFKSPSAAAAVLNNCNSNGRTEWKRAEDGMTLGAWWNRQIERTER